MSSSNTPDTFEQTQRKTARRQQREALRERAINDVGPQIVERVESLRRRSGSSPTLTARDTLSGLGGRIAELEGELTTILQSAAVGRGPTAVAPTAADPLQFIAGRQEGAQQTALPNVRESDIPGLSIEGGIRPGGARRARVRRARVRESVAEDSVTRRRRAIAGFNGEVSEFNLLGTRNSVGAGSLLGGA